SSLVIVVPADRRVELLLLLLLFLVLANRSSSSRDITCSDKAFGLRNSRVPTLNRTYLPGARRI
ncbi:hypothetical protein C5167_026669, partial [Papaver somniferum]